MQENNEHMPSNFLVPVSSSCVSIISSLANILPEILKLRATVLISRSKDLYVSKTAGSLLKAVRLFETD